MIRSRAILAISIISALAVGIGGGYLLWGQSDPEPAAQSLLKEVINQEEGQPETVDFSIFWEVWDTLHRKFVDHDNLDTEALVNGAIHGMVNAAGDQHTVFLEPVTNKKFREDISGAFSGVGMEIAIRDGVLTVVAPLKDSPAERAGLMPGDHVFEVDGVSTEGLPVGDSVSLIRGEKGTTVKLSVFREGVSEKLVFPVVRDTIKIPALELTFLDDGKVAYIRLFTFSVNIDEEFAAASREIEASGVQRLIVDVRNTPGGLLDSAVNLAGWFLEKGTVVVSENFGGGISKSLRSNGKAQFAGLKTVFLINGGSASASEILAGAVHDIRGVPLVGETTFGKGSVQQLEQFKNGSSLKVTVAKWFTPSGVSITEEGIKPTHLVELNAASMTEEELDALEIGTPGSDPQLDRALEIVKEL